MDDLPRDDSEHATAAQRTGFSALLTGIFLVTVGVVATRHEFWRDEMQAWLIARDAPDLSALLEQMHYEGAPPLWSLLLRPAALITHRPEAMQFVTWLLAGATMFIFLRFAPFNRLQKIILIGNYYLLFEYGIVCRNYLMGVLGLAAACIFFASAAKRPWRFVLALTVAAFASVHSLIVAVAMAVGFLGGQVFFRFSKATKTDRTDASFSPPQPQPWLFFAGGIGVAIYSMTPRPDTFYSPAYGWMLNWSPARLANVSWALVASHFPLPRPNGYFWIPPWDTPFRSFQPTTAFVLGFCIFSGAVFALRRHVGALLFYLVGTFGVAAFLYSKYLGFSRHTAFLFFTFLFAVWIKKVAAPPRASNSSPWSDRLTTGALTVMLTCQAVTGIWAIREDWNRPFSCGKMAAQVLTDHHLEGAFIAAGPDWAGAPVAGYLNRTLYYPNALRYGSFIRWDSQRSENLNDEEFLQRGAKEAGSREMVLILDHRPAEELVARFGIETLAELGGSLTPFEDYHLFLVPPKRGALN